MSLKKINERIGTARQKLAEAVKERDGMFAKVDGLRDQVDALETKAELSDDEAASLKTLTAELRTASRDCINAGDKISDMQSDIRNLEAELVARQEQDKLNASLNAPQDRQSTGGDNGEGAASPARPRQEVSREEKDKDISDFFRASYIAKKNSVSIQQVLSGACDNPGTPGMQYSNPRLLAAVTTTTNSALVPAPYSTRLIEMLRPAPVVRNLKGVRKFNLPNGSLVIPRQTGSASATYVGEMAYIPLSNMTTDNITLQAKKLTVMSVQSGEMMRHSDPTSDALIREDIVNAYREKEDVTFIRATATSLIPGGLKYYADQLAASQVITANAANTLASVKQDLGKLRLALRSANVKMMNPVFLMSPRTEQFLMDIIDGNGNPGFPEMERGMLRNMPYVVTTQIPENLGAGTDESEVYIVDASELLVGDTTKYELNVSTEAAYDDGGTIKAAFSQDACVFRLIAEHDTQVRHLQSVAYLSAVSWGA